MFDLASGAAAGEGFGIFETARGLIRDSNASHSFGD
jgi:hypothetical protein